MPSTMIFKSWSHLCFFSQGLKSVLRLPAISRFYQAIGSTLDSFVLEDSVPAYRLPDDNSFQKTFNCISQIIDTIIINYYAAELIVQVDFKLHNKDWLGCWMLQNQSTGKNCSNSYNMQIPNKYNSWDDILPLYPASNAFYWIYF